MTNLQSNYFLCYISRIDELIVINKKLEEINKKYNINNNRSDQESTSSEESHSHDTWNQCHKPQLPKKKICKPKESTKKKSDK